MAKICHISRLGLSESVQFGLDLNKENPDPPNLKYVWGRLLCKLPFQCYELYFGSLKGIVETCWTLTLWVPCLFSSAHHFPLVAEAESTDVLWLA